GVPGQKLSRPTTIAASTRPRRRWAEAEAGPMVQTIFARRFTPIRLIPGRRAGIAAPLGISSAGRRRPPATRPVSLAQPPVTPDRGGQEGRQDHRRPDHRGTDGVLL